MKYISSVLIIFMIVAGMSGCDGSTDIRVVEAGKILAMAEKSGSDVTIKVGGLEGSVPPGSTVIVTNVTTGETKTTTGLADGSFDPEFQGSTSDTFRVEVIDDGETIEDITIGVTLLTDIVQTDLGSLGSVPAAIEIKGDFAYVINGFSDNIQIFDLNQNPPAELLTVALPPGSNPIAMDFLDDSRAFVSNFTGQSVALVNLDTGICELIFLREAGDDTGCSETVIINGAFEDPSDVLVMNGKLYVTNNNFDEFFMPIGNGFVTIIDLQTNQLVDFVETSGANSGKMKLRNDNIMILNTGNFIFNTETSEFECDGKFPPSLDILNTSNDTIAESIAIDLSDVNTKVCGPGSIAISPDNNFAYLGLSLVGALLKIDLQNNTVVNGTDNPIVVTGIEGLNSVSDVIFSGELGFAALFNSDQIAVFDPFTDELNTFPFIAPIPAGIRGINPDSQFFDGVQNLATRDGKGSFDFTTPAVYFITGISQKLGSVDPFLLTDN